MLLFINTADMPYGEAINSDNERWLLVIVSISQPPSSVQTQTPCHLSNNVVKLDHKVSTKILNKTNQMKNPY